jgi:5-methylcytosine-specific restriction endonuclease McrA
VPSRLITCADGSRIPDPRGTQAWRRLAKLVAREEPVCWLGFEGCTRVSTTGDHVIPVVDRPDLALHRANVHGACESCNYKRGNLPVTNLILGTDTEPPDALGIFD